MKKLILIASITVLFLSYSNYINGQSSATKIDYSKRSNILDPDTLRADNKMIFDHFTDLTSLETKNLDSDTIKEEFGKLGLTTNDRKRFISAFSFYANTMTAHKISRENWEEFKYLKPKKEK